VNNKENLKKNIKKTYAEGIELYNNFEEDDLLRFSYHTWYAKAFRIVNRFLPERIKEFQLYYEIDPKRKELMYGNYSIQYYFSNVIPNKTRYPNFNSTNQAKLCLANQLAILNSINKNIDEFVFNIDDSIYYEYQEDELEAAKTVLKVNVRAAGALCGVVIEKHLKRLLGSRILEIRTKHPGIVDLAQQLRKDDIIEIPDLKNLEYLASIRNLCDHQKGREPSREEVQILINGTERVIKTLSW